jgi:hypothetical protein
MAARKQPKAKRPKPRTAARRVRAKKVRDVASPSSTLTRRQLAAKLHVHMQTVTRWEQDGLPLAFRGHRGVCSRYREVEVRAWLQTRDEAARAPGAPQHFLQARATKEQWQARLAEQQHKLRSGDLLPREEVERVWGAEVAAVRSLILSSYVTHADRVHRASTLEGLAGVERELKDLAHEILRELADPNRAPCEAVAS